VERVYAYNLVFVFDFLQAFGAEYTHYARSVSDLFYLYRKRVLEVAIKSELSSNIPNNIKIY
jgi:hypothetical protein